MVPVLLAGTLAGCAAKQGDGTAARVEAAAAKAESAANRADAAARGAADAAQRAQAAAEKAEAVFAHHLRKCFLNRICGYPPAREGLQAYDTMPL